MEVLAIIVMVDVAIVVLMHHVMAMCLILLLFLNTLGLFKMSSCMHATPGVAKVSMPCRYHWHPKGALSLVEFQTLFKFTAGHATPVLHAVRTAKTHALLKSMWNI